MAPVCTRGYPPELEVAFFGAGRDRAVEWQLKPDAPPTVTAARWK